MKTTLILPHRVRFGVFEVDLQSSELLKQGRKIRLQEQPFRILALLLEQRGHVVTREELRKRLWSDDTFVDFDHSLNTAVMRLRESLGDSSDNPRFIETLPRHGYRFIAPAEEIALEPEESGTIEAVSTPSAGPESLSVVPSSTKALPAQGSFAGWRRMLPVAAMLAAAIALMLNLVVQRAQNTSRASAASSLVKSVVVLPFENLSGDKDQQYFTDGMTDELIAHLAKVRSLRVISRTSAMEYKGTHKTLTQIAQDLNVDAVVEGTVLRYANQVRITAELVQVTTDRHLWAETYQGELGDILKLQSEVASAIVNEIRINLTPEEQQQLATTRSVSAVGYEDYLKGRYYWNKRSEEGLNKAIGYFELATKEDPNSALAFAGLADCYSIIGSAIVGTVPAGEVAPKARAAAARALELDNSLAEAETSLATVKFNYDWDWSAAGHGFRRSIALNPSYATAYQRYSLYLMALGKTDESLAQMNRARALDPLSISMNFSLGWRLYMARQYGPAIEQLRNTLDLDPGFALARMVLGQAYEQMGVYGQAIPELEKAVSLSHDSPPMLGALGHAYALAGRKLDAERVLQRMMAQGQNQYVSPFYVALVYIALKDQPNALNWLEKAYADRSNAVIFLQVDPQLDGIRSAPRFQELVRRMALRES